MNKKTKYRKEFEKLIYECIVDKFMYLKDIAKVMNVNYDTLNEWLKVDSKYFKSELSESYHRALKDKQQRIIEKTQEQLYKSAWGYEYKEVKQDSQGDIIYTVTKQAHPNAKACLDILARLNPKEWDNSIKIIEVEKNNYDNMTEEEIDRELQQFKDEELLQMLRDEIEKEKNIQRS
ncbi:MAG: hypothetical protein KFW21_04715 [Spirochaetota bacterium]|nr:hypothetical protein [Spirochaetota bacterium]